MTEKILRRAARRVELEARKLCWQIAGVSNGPVGICAEHRNPAANFARAALAAD
jgi:hypothetical protein